VIVFEAALTEVADAALVEAVPAGCELTLAEETCITLLEAAALGNVAMAWAAGPTSSSELPPSCMRPTRGTTPRRLAERIAERINRVRRWLALAAI
jgi:hypothetical protein